MTDDMTDASPVIPTDEELAAIRRVTPHQAVLLVESGRGTLVDTRYRGSFEGGHIDGAITVSLEAIETELRLPKLEAIPANHQIILYCTCLDEYTSARAAVALVRRGYDPSRLAVLQGGLLAWRDVGLPIIRIRGKGVSR